MPSLRHWLLALILASFAATATPAAPVFLERWGGPIRGTGPREFESPSGIAIGPNGHIYVAEFGNARVQELTASGEFVRFIGERGAGPDQFWLPTDIAVDRDGNLYVCDYPRMRILKFASDGRFLMNWSDRGPGIPGISFSPYCITVDREGNLYVGDNGTKTIVRFSNTGEILARWDGGETGDGPFKLLEGLAVDANGAVYAADDMTCRIFKFTADGRFLAKWGGRGTVGPRFLSTWRMAYDESGLLFVADPGNQRVAVLDTLGRFVEQIGGFRPISGAVFDAYSLALDGRGRIITGQTNSHSLMVFGPRPDAAPVAIAGPDTTAECASPAGTRVRLDGSRSYDPDGEAFEWRWSAAGVSFDDPSSQSPTGVFPHGTTLVTLTVIDTALVATDTVRVTVSDTAAPTLTVTLSPGELWPPGRRMAAIHATVVAKDACDELVNVTLASITNSECGGDPSDDRARRQGDEDSPGEGGDRGDPGHGDHCDDAVLGAEFGTADFDFQLRAGRRGGRAERTYTVCYEAVDGSGHRALACANVLVSHDRRDHDRHINSPPLRFLADARPNPAHGATEISYELPEGGPVTLRVYDVAGRLVATLVDGIHTAGRYSAHLKAAGRGKGAQVLLYRLQWNGRTLSGRVLMLD